MKSTSPCPGITAAPDPRSHRAWRPSAMLLGLLLLAQTAIGSSLEYFSERRISLSWQNAVDVELLDWNQDGRLDVVAISADGDGVDVWTRQSVSWSPINLTGVGTTQGRALAVGDLDGDGTDDIAYVMGDNLNATVDDEVGVVLNASPTTYDILANTVEAPVDVALADLDRDGDLDVIVAFQGLTSLNWYENDGSGTSWTTHTISAGSGTVNSIDAADVDMDGDPDLVLATSDRVRWLQNRLDESLSWLSHDVVTGIGEFLDLELADMDGDGEREIVATADGTTNDVLGVWQRSSPVTQAWTGNTIANSIAIDLELVDGDQDGDIDIFGKLGDGVTWWENTLGGLAFQQQGLITDVPSPSGAIALGDMSGDGDVDIVIAAETDDEIQLYENVIIRSSTDFVDLNTFVRGSGNDPVAFELVDLDADGDLDIVSFDEDGILAYRDGLTAARLTLFDTMGETINGVDALRVADFDQDGDLDIALGSSAGIEWFEQFSFPAPFGRNTIFTTSLQEFEAYDIEGDGDIDIDIVGWDSFNESLVVFTNTNSGASFAGFTLDATVTGFLDMVAVDYDTDGRVEALVSASDGITAYEASSQSFLNGSALFAAIDAADYDRDGDIDIAGFVEADDEVVLLSNTGSGYSPTALDAPPDGLALESTDLDNDGDLELLLASSQEAALASGDNRGLLPAALVGLGEGLTQIEFGDLTQDGFTDLLAMTADGKLAAFETIHGQFAATFPPTATSTVVAGIEQKLLDVEIEHLGRPFEQDLKPTHLRLTFRDTSGTPLTNGQLAALLDEVRIIRRDGIDEELASASGGFSNPVTLVLPFALDNFVEPPLTQTNISVGHYEVVSTLKADAALTLPSFQVHVAELDGVEATSTTVAQFALERLPTGDTTRTYAVDGGLIFADGFESGNTSSWN